MLVGLLAAGLERAPCKRFGDRRGCPAPLLIETSFNNHSHSWGGDESGGRGLCGVAQALGRKELCLWGHFPGEISSQRLKNHLGTPFSPNSLPAARQVMFWGGVFGLSVFSVPSKIRDGWEKPSPVSSAHLNPPAAVGSHLC